MVGQNENHSLVTVEIDDVAHDTVHSFIEVYDDLMVLPRILGGTNRVLLLRVPPEHMSLKIRAGKIEKKKQREDKQRKQKEYKDGRSSRLAKAALMLDEKEGKEKRRKRKKKDEANI